MGWIGDHLEEKDAKSCSIREVEKDKTIIQKKKRIHPLRRALGSQFASSNARLRVVEEPNFKTGRCFQNGRQKAH